MSPEFFEIWSRPLLVDGLIAVWEFRNEQQKRRDEMAMYTMHLADVYATDQRNINRGKDDKPYGSILKSLLPQESKIKVDDNLQERIIAAEQRRRENLGIKH